MTKSHEKMSFSELKKKSVVSGNLCFFRNFGVTLQFFKIMGSIGNFKNMGEKFLGQERSFISLDL